MLVQYYLLWEEEGHSSNHIWTSNYLTLPDDTPEDQREAAIRKIIGERKWGEKPIAVCAVEYETGKVRVLTPDIREGEGH